MREDTEVSAATRQAAEIAQNTQEDGAKGRPRADKNWFEDPEPNGDDLSQNGYG